METLDLRGAIITDRGNSLLARGIRKFMKWYNRITWRQTGVNKKEGYGNHARIVLEQMVDDPLTVLQAEAIKDGAKQKWNDLRDDKDFKIFQLNQPLSEEEHERLLDAFDEIQGRKYQIWNFMAWMIYVGSFKHISLFRKEPKSHEKFYCFELVAYLSNMAREGLFDDYEEITSIHEIESNPNYKEITL